MVALVNLGRRASGECPGIDTRKNRRFVLRERPVDRLTPDVFDLETGPVPAPGEGQALVRAELAAISPWQAARTRGYRNYVAPFAVGETIDGDVFGRVIESRAEGLSPGDHVVGRLGWRDYALATPDRVRIASPDFAPEAWLTVLSSPGQTAYLALSRRGRPMPGETMVVTSAAGAVGSVAVELGRLAGMRVVGIAGGPERTAFVRATLGAHAALDRHADTFEADLAGALPDGVDLFFDTVGGRLGNQVLEHLAHRATVVLVGRSDANTGPTPEHDPVNMRRVWTQEASVRTFSRYGFAAEEERAIGRLGQLLKAGLLRAHHTVVTGFERLPEALCDLLAGRHLGKVLVRLGTADGRRL